MADKQMYPSSGRWVFPNKDSIIRKRQIGVQRPVPESTARYRGERANDK